MADRFRLALSLGVAPSPALMSLAREISRRVAVADLGDCLSTEPALIRAEWSRPPDIRWGGPQVWWVDRADQLPEISATQQPRMYVSDSPDLAAAAYRTGVQVRLIPEADAEPGSCPVPPFVRERLRRDRSLGEGLLVQDGPTGWLWNGQTIVAAERISTALAAAAAVHVSSPHSLVRAMAWGCPVIATQSAIAATGVQAPRDVLGDTGADPLEQLRALASDPRLSARLSRDGRRRYEMSHSVGPAADAVLAALGVAVRWHPSALQHRLNELDSRRGEAQRARVADMVSAIVDWEEAR